MEENFEKPPKQRRLLLESHSHYRDLRALVHQLTKVPLSDYYRESTPRVVDEFFARFADLLRQSSGGGYDDRFLLAQVHGMLLQWLDFIVTQQPPRDITTQDESAIVKVTRSAVHICRCLKEVYRCSPNLYQYEGLLILVRTLLTTTQPMSINVQTPLPILHMVKDVTLQTDAGLLPASLKQRFVLALLESLARDEDNKFTYTRDNYTSETLNADYGSASTASLSILSHLASTKLTSGSDCICNLAQIALKSFSEDRPSMGIAATNLTNELFHLQCVLRLPAFQPHGDTRVDLAGLVKTSLAVREEATHRIQAMDCMVTLAGRCAQLNPKPTLTASLNAALLEILSTSGGSTIDRIVKYQAVDGLRLLLDNDEALNDCIEALYKQEDNKKTRRFLSSLVEMACSRRQRYYQGSMDEHGLLTYVLCRHVDNTVETGAAEILLSILCIVCTNIDDDEQQHKNKPTLVSNTEVAAICHSLLRQGSEHLIYLTVRTIYQHDAALFFDVAEMHPEILSSLAEVLGSLHRSIPPVTLERILRFFVDLLQVRPLLVPVVARQPGVVDAIARVLATTTSNTATTNATNAIRPLAASLLFELASNVCNRLILARTHRVLAGLIQYAREVRHDEHPQQQISDGAEPTTTLAIPLCHRQVMKERIAQLAQVL